jgi:hypothetical protein
MGAVQVDDLHPGASFARTLTMIPFRAWSALFLLVQLVAVEAQ